MKNAAKLFWGLREKRKQMFLIFCRSFKGKVNYSMIMTIRLLAEVRKSRGGLQIS